MAVMDNPFACTNGHKFRANAKIRARCPECGAMARRDFSQATPTTEGNAPEPTEHKPITKPVILRQGRTPVVAKKPRSAAQLANDKRLSEMRKKATSAAPKSVRSATKPRVANGLVKTARVTRPSIPTVNRRPKRTAVAGQIKSMPGKSKSFMDQVIDNFKLF